MNEAGLIRTQIRGGTSKRKTMLEIDLASLLKTALKERPRREPPPVWSVVRICECVSDVCVPVLQAPDSTATPPSTVSAPAGPGAPPVTWCRDPVRRCSTAFVTTPPVSAAPSAPASRNNGFQTRFPLPPLRATHVYGFVK